MLYTKIENGQALFPAFVLEFFVSQGNIESVNATPEELVAANIVPVIPFIGTIPIDGYQYGVDIIQQPDGTWAQTLVQRTISEEQHQHNVNILSQAVKADRNRMLASCDWVVAKSIENATPVPDGWKAYRQALRDIPLQKGFPFNITWPQLP